MVIELVVVVVVVGCIVSSFYAGETLPSPVNEPN